MVSLRSLSDSKYPGLFSVFWPMLVILLFGWFPVFLLYPSPPVYVSLVTVPSVQITIGITVTFVFHSFLVLLQGLGFCGFFFFVMSFGHQEQQSPLIGRFTFLCFSFVFWQSLGLFIWLLLLLSLLLLLLVVVVVVVVYPFKTSPQQSLAYAFSLEFELEQVSSSL